MWTTAVVGYLMQKEIDFLGNAVNNPERPFVAIHGGAKVSSKISVIENLLDKVDVLIIGGEHVLYVQQGHGRPISEPPCARTTTWRYALRMMKKGGGKGREASSSGGQPHW